MLPSQFNYDLNAISLVKGTGSPPELYIPLWWYSGANAGFNASNLYLQKGSTSTTSSVNASTKLHTLNANWSPNIKYAFEISLGLGAASSATASLIDLTSTPTTVAGSSVTCSSTTMTVLRSGQFTLIPGHVYGVVLSANSSAYACDASLIVFPS